MAGRARLPGALLLPLLICATTIARPAAAEAAAAEGRGAWASRLGGWWSHSRWGRSLQAQATKHEGSPCPHLSADLLAGIAQENTILLAAADHLVAPAFGMNWIRNVEAAGITYWLMGALDPEASLLFGEAGVRQCANSPYGGMLKTWAGELPGRHCAALQPAGAAAAAGEAVSCRARRAGRHAAACDTERCHRLHPPQGQPLQASAVAGTPECTACRSPAQASNFTGAASIGTRRCGKRCTLPASFCSTATTSSSATWTPRGCCCTPQQQPATDLLQFASAAASHAAWPPAASGLLWGSPALQRAP